LRVIRRPKFLDDRYDAYAWIASESERSAERLQDRIEAAIEHLREFPMTGVPREELAVGLRSIRVRPFQYIIFYRVSEDEIVLIRLLHSARALERQDYQP
jgi:toxin ParE1/3/4